MLTCQELTELVTDYLEGRLSLMQRVQFHLHVGMCRHCRAYLRQMRMTVRTLGHLPDEPIPPGMRDELLERFRTMLPRGGGPGSSTSRGLRFVAALEGVGSRWGWGIAGAIVVISILALVLAAGSSACNGTSATEDQGRNARAPQQSAHQGARGHAMKQYEYPSSERVGTLPAGVGIAVGQPAPDAIVTDADGHAVRVHDLFSDGPILLVFYRGGWCPFCSMEIHELTVAYPQYQRRGIRPVAISVDRAEASAHTRATYAIPFPVLSDPDLEAHRAFHVMHHADDAEVARLKGFGMDIEQASGRTHHVIAIPSIFVIDRRGIVRWAHADPNYKVRPSTEQILDAIDGLDLSTH